MSPIGVVKTKTARQRIVEVLACALTSTCMILMHWYIIREIKYDTSTRGIPSSAIGLRFDEQLACDKNIPNIHSLLVTQIDTLGGSSINWEQVLSFSTAGEIKTVSIYSSDGTPSSFQVFENQIMFWLPEWILRSLSLGTIQISRAELAIYLKGGETNATCIDIGVNETSKASLLNYLFLQVNEKVEIFNSDSTEYWFCTGNEVCSLVSSTQWNSSTVAVLIIWALVVVISVGIWFDLYVSIIRGLNASSLPSNAFIAGMFHMFLWTADSKPKNVSRLSSITCIKNGILEMLILMSPAFLPMLIVVMLGCEDHLSDTQCASRKSTIIFPISFMLTLYICACVILIAIRRGLEFSLGKIATIFRGAAFLLVTLSVILFASNIVWIVAALTVDPVGSGSILIAFASLFIYAFQTYRRLSKIGDEFSQKMKLYKVKDIEATMERMGTSKNQIAAFVVMSSLLFACFIVWLLLCSIIFTSNQPGSSNSFFHVLQAGIIPLFGSLQHIWIVSSKTAKMKDMTPFSDTINAAADSIMNDSNLKTDLKEVAEVLKK